MGARAIACVVALGILGSSGACVPGARPPASDSPAPRLREAVVALESDDFALARHHLVAVASQCAEPELERRAMLLLAAAELDTGNPDGSPLGASMVAERFLRLPGASPEERILARSLLRLATHLQTLAPVPGEGAEGGGIGPRAVEGCAPAEQGSDESDDALGSAEAPWLLGLDAKGRSAHRRIAELEAEMRRITDLLTSGTTPDAGEQPR